MSQEMLLNGCCLGLCLCVGFTSQHCVKNAACKLIFVMSLYLYKIHLTCRRVDLFQQNGDGLQIRCEMFTVIFKYLAYIFCQRILLQFASFVVYNYVVRITGS